MNRQEIDDELSALADRLFYFAMQRRSILGRDIFAAIECIR